MQVEGEMATRYTAVRLDSLQSVEGKGTLLRADTDTGEVRWRDHTDTVCETRLGPNSIKLVGRR
jgi:hypothetical protein